MYRRRASVLPGNRKAQKKVKTYVGTLPGREGYFALRIRRDRIEVGERYPDYQTALEEVGV